MHDTAGASVELKDRWIHFLARDVYYPELAAVLTQLHGDDLFQGLVVDVTDDGGNGRYAVVEVEGVKQPIVVAVHHILGVL